MTMDRSDGPGPRGRWTLPVFVLLVISAVLAFLPATGAAPSAELPPVHASP